MCPYGDEDSITARVHIRSLRHDVILQNVHFDAPPQSL